MKREELNTLIDRVTSGKGILRAPSYWVRRLFNAVIGYAEDLINKKPDIYILQAGEYAVDSETGKKLLEIFNNPDKYILQSWVNNPGGKILVKYNVSKYEFIKSNIYLVGYARITSTSAVSGKLYKVEFTEYTGNIIKNDDTITVAFSDTVQSVPFGKGVDEYMSNYSEYTVSNKVIKAYVDDAVTRAGVAVVDNLETESRTAALSAKQGRVLAERIGDIDTILNNINGEEI